MTSEEIAVLIIASIVGAILFYGVAAALIFGIAKMIRATYRAIVSKHMEITKRAAYVVGSLFAIPLAAIFSWHCINVATIFVGIAADIIGRYI